VIKEVNSGEENEGSGISQAHVQEMQGHPPQWRGPGYLRGSAS
jgi:hypothetical protein